MKIKRRFFKSINLLIIVILVFFSHSSMGSVFSVGQINGHIITSGLILLMFVGKLLTKRNIKYRISSIFIILFLIANILVTMTFNDDFTNGYIIIILALISAFIFIGVYSRDEFVDNYAKVFVFLSAYSLISTYVFMPIITSMGLNVSTYTNVNGIQYINMIFATPIRHFAFQRNTGLFIEPGMYQVFLSFALIFELFLVKRKSKFINVFIIILASITTFSPIAYLQIVLIVFAYFFLEKNILNYKKAKALFKTVLIFIIISLFTFIFVPNVSSAALYGIDKMINRESSFQIRVGSIIANVLSGFESPIYGQGITFGFQNTLTNYLGHISIHNTSTSTAMFMLFGIVFSVLLLYLQYKTTTKGLRKMSTKMVLLIASLIAVNAQLLLYDQMFYIIIFSGLMKTNNLDTQEQKGREI